jgi:hypothetical protein
VLPPCDAGGEHADALLCEVGVAFVDVDADGVAAVRGGDLECRAAAGERVEDDAAPPCCCGRSRSSRS